MDAESFSDYKKRALTVLDHLRFSDEVNYIRYFAIPHALAVETNVVFSFLPKESLSPNFRETLVCASLNRDQGLSQSTIRQYTLLMSFKFLVTSINPENNKGW